LRPTPPIAKTPETRGLSPRFAARAGQALVAHGPGCTNVRSDVRTRVHWQGVGQGVLRLFLGDDLDSSRKADRLEIPGEALVSGREWPFMNQCRRGDQQIGIVDDNRWLLSSR